MVKVPPVIGSSGVPPPPPSSMRSWRVLVAIPMEDDGDESHEREPAHVGLTLLTVTENGYGKRTDVNDYRVHPEEGPPRSQSRGGKGRADIKTTGRNGRSAAATLVGDDDDVVVISRNGQLVRIVLERNPSASAQFERILGDIEASHAAYDKAVRDFSELAHARPNPDASTDKELEVWCEEMRNYVTHLHDKYIDILWEIEDPANFFVQQAADGFFNRLVPPQRKGVQLLAGSTHPLEWARFLLGATVLSALVLSLWRAHAETVRRKRRKDAKRVARRRSADADRSGRGTSEQAEPKPGDAPPTVASLTVEELRDLIRKETDR